MDIIEKLRDRALSRRTFAAGLASAAALAAAGCTNDVALPGTTTGTLGYTGADVLNFALNLEYLEAEFYLRAATGSGLSSTDAGTSPGAVNGGAKLSGLTTAQQNILDEIAFDEQQHVKFLRSALGSSAVVRPAIDFTNGFATAVTAANGISSSLPAIPTGFSPFTIFDHFLVAAFIFEDVGVTAYNGAAPLISAAGIASGYLTAAAGILAVEAYHAAYVRTALTANTITQGSTAYPFALYANRVSLLRAALGGGNETALTGFSTAPTTTAQIGTSTLASNSQSYSSIVAADSNALAYYRSTSQVLHIVYGTATAGATSGLFYPSGLNGNIKTAA